MPIVKRDRAGTNPLKRSFVDRVRTGHVVPVIAAGMQVDLVLGGQDRFTEGYADYSAFPLEDRHDLLKMAKYKAIIENWKGHELQDDFLDYVKRYHIYDLGEARGLDPELLEEAGNEVDSLSASAFAARLEYPRFDQGQEDPLLILADLPLPIYLTTSPFTFLEAALRRAGKEPQTDFCRWHTGLGRIDAVSRPSDKAPLVFHLFGLDTQPNSLVLTEDDYLQFLIMVSQGEGTDNDSIPDPVRRALSESSLVLLGFEMASWSFRVLFWGLIKPATMGLKTQRGFCCLQVTPSEKERQFLEDYLKREVDFEVFWGDVQAYTQELNRMWRQ